MRKGTAGGSTEDKAAYRAFVDGSSNRQDDMMKKEGEGKTQNREQASFAPTSFTTFTPPISPSWRPPS